MERKQLLVDLKEIVLRELPGAVKEIELDPEEKVCFIALFGGAEFNPLLGLIQLGVQSWRTRDIEKYGIDAKHTIWNSGQMPVEYQNIIRDAEFNEKEERLDKLDDWEETWKGIQELRFELARHFNAYDWSNILPVTDDFVVYSEWEGIDVENGDLEPSIPQEKWAMLKERNLI